MRPVDVGKRISLANEALFSLGATAFLGSSWSQEPVEYLDEDGHEYEFRPLEQFGDADAD